ncbi:MAG TPA: hypothetical protein VGH10_09305 [Actinomycetota bacterium]
MDITTRLQQLIEMVQEAKSMPLSASVLVNREEMLELLEACQNDLPEEIKQARWVVKDREELLAKARKDSETIVAKARSEQARLVSKEEVVKTSQEEADRVLSEASLRARELRLEAEDYVDAKLAAFEIAMERTGAALEKAIGQVQRGRDKLRGVTPAEQEFGPGTPAAGDDDTTALFDVEEQA